MTTDTIQLRAAIRHVHRLDRSTAFYVTAFDLKAELSEIDAVTLVDSEGERRLALRQRGNRELSALGSQTLVWTISSGDAFDRRCDLLLRAGYTVRRRNARGGEIASIPDPDGYGNLLVAAGVLLEAVPPEVYTY
jgi:hypothetical protein